jgi:hypothetical protein
MRRHVLFVVAPACLLVGVGPVAWADVAPPGSANATAAQVGSLVGISRTGATAAPDTSSSHASVVEVGGQPVLGLGGATNGDGDSGGALLDTGSNLPAHLQVAPWHSSASSTGSVHSSNASTAAARADAANLVRAGILTSQSQATHQATKSTAAGASDGVDLALADMMNIVLLHSEVNSQGHGHSYLVGVNGTEIGTDQQLGSTCALHAENLLALSCLTASGGVAGNLTSGDANLAAAKTALATIDPVTAFSVTANSGNGSAPLSVQPAAGAAPALAAESTRAFAAPAAAPTEIDGQTTGRLPHTGTAVASLLAAGIGALISGRALRRFGRRHRPVAA